MRIWLPAGTVVVVAGALIALGMSGGGGRTLQEGGPPPAGAAQLVAYPSCAQMLVDLRTHTADNIGVLGLGPDVPAEGDVLKEGVPSAATSLAPATPEHSTTTVHEAGVDEPDVVKTDGRRVLTVERGVLRVVDTATRRVTGSVRVAALDQAWTPANLLVHGDRALVILPVTAVGFAKQPDVRPGVPQTRFVLVDLNGTPRVAGALTVRGSYVDARMVGGTARLVARSHPDLAFPPVPGTEGPTLQHNQAIVRQQPISAWLPRYEITDAAGTTSTRTVGCGQVRHPRDYTGTSMLTIYSVDLDRGLGDIPPISLAADGDIVYGTTTSLYVASNPQWWYPVPIAGPALPRGGAVPVPPVPPIRKLPPQQTSVHRFEITGSGAPRYVASGAVPGRLLNQYSLSDYDGYLRVATTTGAAVEGSTGTSQSAVYELNADTMARAGAVDGLGKGQRIYSVRFIGAVGYVVTFRQTDPLYTLDLSDPSAPRVAGELELSGYSAYLSPAGGGRLIGVGQEANTQGRVAGLQVSLFDVRDPAHPQLLSRVVEPQTSSQAEYDPHAFLYWPATGTAVLPTSSWNGSASALVLKIADSAVRTEGTIAGTSRMGIMRATVIGDSLWTLSADGLQVNDAATLAKQAWIPLN